MKIRIIAVVMLSAVFSLAQTFTETKPVPGDEPKAASVAQAQKQTDCPCCQKMAEGKDAQPGCCQHDAATKGETQAASCCQGKDGISCMKGDPDKSSAAGSKGGHCCGDDKKGCCQKTGQTSEHAAMACCKGGHCGAGHDHGNVNK